MLMFVFFFFNHTATTEIYSLSLHDALPICALPMRSIAPSQCSACESPNSTTVVRDVRSPNSQGPIGSCPFAQDRKSTRLNSSHLVISYAVFCLKKKIHENSNCSLDYLRAIH